MSMKDIKNTLKSMESQLAELEKIKNKKAENEKKQKNGKVIQFKEKEK